MLTCPKCGEQTSAEFAICPNCGSSIAEVPAAELVAAATATEKRKSYKKVVMYGGIGVTIIVVLALLFSLFFGNVGKAKNNYALYLKDGEIFFSDLKNSDAWQLTSRLVDSDKIQYKDLADASFRLGLYTCYISKDGKYIFFPDKMSEDNEGFNLYYKEVAKPDAEAIKVDSDVQSYAVNTSGTLVTYLKGEEQNLYQYKISEDSKDKIASEVEYFDVSDDGKKIIYRNSENSIYLKYADKEKDKIASDISSLEYISKDLTTIYYVKDGSLYKQVEGEDKVKIVSDVCDEFIQIYDSGEAYYLKKEVREIPLMDYVIDDMKNADASMKAPEYPNYPSHPRVPSRQDYDTDEEYDAARDAYYTASDMWEAECDRLQEEYYAAREAYYEKVARDELREDLEGETLERPIFSLCFYNGTEKTTITDTLASYYSYAYNSPVISYAAYDQSTLEKVKLSEVDSTLAAKDMIKDALFSSTKSYIAVKSTSTIVEQEKEAKCFVVNPSGTVVYYFDNISDEHGHGELYRISIANGLAKKAELYDSDVYPVGWYFSDDNTFKYFKDYKNNHAELYVNKNKIASDVYYTSPLIYPEHNKIVYLTNWDSEKKCGTLKIYDGKESTKIADDVHDFSVTPDGQVLYLYDYSLNYYKGELREWSNGKARKLDDDVISILSVSLPRFRSS